MILSVKIKVWILIANALIICGAGHGLAFLFLIEIFYFPGLGDNVLYLNFQHVSNHFAATALFTLLGQVFVLLSIFYSGRLVSLTLYLFGLLFLLLGISYFIYDTSWDNSIVLVLLSALPFVYLIIRSLIGKYIGRLFRALYVN